MGKFYMESEKQGYRFRLLDSSGQMTVVSRWYSTVINCRRGAESFCKNAKTIQVDDQTREVPAPSVNPCYVIRQEGSGFAFSLRARNGEELASSLILAEKEDCERSIQRVRRSTMDGVEWVKK